MKSLYKIWSRDRTQKCLIIIDDDTEDKYAELILKASAKLNIDGSSLVLESDGTPIDDSSLLEYLKQETLIMLESGSKWIAAIKDEEQSSSSLPTTLTVSSANQSETSLNDVNISSMVDCNIEYYWHSFELPMDLITNDHKEILDKGICSKQIKSNLVHVVVDKMRSVRKQIPTKAFRIVARKLIENFPLALRDCDEDGIVLGDGTHSLVNKLQERNNYLNRPHKNPNSAMSSPIVSKKRNVSARAGCSNWSPTTLEGKENVDILKSSSVNITDANFLQIMENTYGEQRKFLNQYPPPSMENIREEWPILLSTRGIFWHFAKLTDSDINLLDQSKEKATKLLNFCRIASKSKQNEDTTCSNIYINLLDELTNRFKEKIDEFYIKTKNLFDPEDSENMPITPFIMHLENNDNPSHFYVFVDREQVTSEGYQTFEEAFQVAFALFFNFNIKYPPKCCVTLELIQRYFFKIHPDSGSKSKEVAATKKKIFSLLNKLK